jgi:hypothetical protein
MYAYELLARCRHLTLCGIGEHGELEWEGTYLNWVSVESEKVNIVYLDRVDKEFQSLWR